jgi:hypothetical protein
MKEGSAPNALSSHSATRNRLLKRIAFHGDEGKAAGSLGMSRNQLMKLNDPKIRQEIESEKESAHDEGGWRGIIFRAKVLPHIGSKGRKSAEIVAAWVVLNGLKKSRKLVADEANAGNDEFFIALGRYLSGKRKRLWDPVDKGIAQNWKRTLLRLSRRAGAEWMRAHGFPSLSDAAFRQRLVSLRLTKRAKAH